MTTGWVEVRASESPEAAALDAEASLNRVDGAVIVERGSWDDAVKVTQYLRARPDPVPVRLSPMDETAEEWAAALRALPHCVHVFVERRCFKCSAVADAGVLTDGEREWPVCKQHIEAVERGSSAAGVG